jgi:FkbM family methyltransferase
MFYYQARNKIQTKYYEAWHEAGMKGGDIASKTLTKLKLSKSHYINRYKRLAKIRSNLHPYQFIDKSSTVIACGCHNGKIGLGLSQPIIFSTLAKHVIVLEPDPVNLSALNDYISKYKIKNITVVPKAVWHTEETVEFTVCGRTESNQIGKLNSRGKQISVSATTLDKLALEYGQIDLVHLTINGTEFQALEGATEMLKTSTEVSIAMLFKRHGMFKRRMRAIDLLKEHGHFIGCANAPPRAWVQTPWYFAVGTKDEDKLVNLNFKNEEVPW